MARLELDRQMALVLLVKEILDQINEVSALRAQGSPARIGMAMLRETCSVLQELPDEEKLRYYEFLATFAGSQPAGTRTVPSEEVTELMQLPRRSFVEMIRNSLKAA